MTPKPTALLLVPESPYPIAGGGAMRAAALTEYLAQHYEFDVVVFRQPLGADPKSTRLGELARRIIVLDLNAHARHTFARVTRNLTRLARGVPPLTDRFSGFEREMDRLLGNHDYDLAVVEHFWCASYLDLLTKRAKHTVLDLHNIESCLHESCASAEPWPLSAVHHQFQRACRRLERRWLPGYDRVLTASGPDAERIRLITPGTTATVYPNTIPWFPPPERREIGNVIIFTANMEYHPNSDAVRYFSRQIWPLVKERCPDLRWRLVGKNPEAVRRYVAVDPCIELVGPVDDVMSELAQAKVAIVPLRAGSGTRIKILEAWAAGTPVVSTALGAEGLATTDGGELVIADKPRLFADAVINLLSSTQRRRCIGDAGRVRFERDFTWEAGWRVLASEGL